MGRIGSLEPVDVDTPHGVVRVLSRYREDKQCYRLNLYGAVQAVQWLLPKRTVMALSGGMARAEVSPPEQPITTIGNLDIFRRALMARWEERLQLGPDDPATGFLAGQPAMAPVAPLSLASLIERYFAVHGHLRARSAVSYRTALTHWTKRLGGGLPLASLTADAIRLAQAHIAAATSPATANGCLRVLKVVLNYAVAEAIMTHAPHRRVAKLVAPPRSARWWTPAEVAQVLHAAPEDPVCPRDGHLLFTLALYLGLRKGELDRLRWEDLQIAGDRPVCMVRSTSDQPTKSGHARVIPICRALRTVLERYRDSSGWVLRPDKQPGVWNYRFESDALFARVVAAAGVTSIRFHDMRHTFASLMLAAGVPLFKVSVWLGHSDIRVTQQVYAHLAPYDPQIDLLQIGNGAAEARICDPICDPCVLEGGRIAPAEPSPETSRRAGSHPGMA